MTQESPNSTPKAASTQPTSTKPPKNQGRLQALWRLVGQLGGIGLAFIPVLWNLLRRLGQLTVTCLRWLYQQWQALLPQIRTILPAPWKTKLPDFAITAVAVGLLVLLLGIPVGLLTHRSPAKVANAPAPQIDRRPTPTPAEPAPDLNRIAAIQEQMTEATAEYAEGLIQAVQVNFLRSRLTVSVSNDWYELDGAQQERLANEWLKRSKKLAFEKLEISDPEGSLLARSPVVGPKMVILTGAQGQA